MNTQEKITVRYTRDFNIIDLDLKIKKRLREMVPAKKSEYELEIKKLRFEISQPQTLLERKNSITKLGKLIVDFDRLKSVDFLSSYIEATKELVEQYRSIKPKIVFREFGSVEEVGTPEEIHRLNIIGEYLKRARDFYPLDINYVAPEKKGCTNCGNSEESIKSSQDSVGYCPGCGIEQKILIRPLCQKEISGEPVLKSTGYENRETFYKAFIIWQGKQTVCFPPDLFKELDAYFTSRDFPSGAEISKSPLLKYGRRGAKTSKEWMIKALSECGYTNYFEDWRLICKLYWGWVLPNLDYLTEQVMEIYDRTQKILEEIPDRRRKKSQNAQFRLRGILMGLGVECINDDFKFIKTDATLDDHERTWEIMCKGVGLKYVPV